MSVARTVRRLTNATQIVTPRYVKWLSENADKPLPDWVVGILAEHMRKVPRDRSGSFAGSAAGDCLRAQELTFLGKPPSIERTIDPQLQHIFDDGKWRHLRWQGFLLAAGIIERIEVPAPWPRMFSKGTMDGAGTVWDDHPNVSWRGEEFGFELKGVNPFQYSRWVKGRYPIDKHMAQIHRYFLVTGLEYFSVIYENKGTNQWHEWVVRPIPELLKESQQELDELNRAREKQRLHEILPSCKIRKGANWESCSFAGVGGTCERTKRWR